MIRLFRLAWREITANKRFNLFFVLNLSVGLLGFTTIEAFKSALDTTLVERSKSALAADLEVGARRPLTDKEVELINKTLPQGHQSSQVTWLYSMAVSENNTQLVNLKAVEEPYPFYGKLRLQKPVENPEGSSVPQGDGVWVYPEVLVHLNIEIGDTIQLGEWTARIENVIEDDAANLFSVGLAPRIYISQEQLKKTRLIRPGSTAFFTQIIKLPSTVRVEAINEALEEKLDDPAVQITTYKNANEDMGVFLKYLNDYLGLAALVALFLSGVGATFLYRNFFAQRQTELAILNSLGLTALRAEVIFSIHALILGVATTIPTLLFSQLLLPFVNELTQGLIQVDLPARLTSDIVLKTLILGSLSSLVICLPVLLRMAQIRPAQLFSEGINEGFRFNGAIIAAHSFQFLLFWLAAVWQARSWQVGTTFFAIFVVATLFLLLVAGHSIKWLAKKKTFSHYTTRLATRNLEHHRFSTLTGFLSLALGMLLLNLLPQLKASLNEELQNPKGSKLPSLFLFDIQDEQVDPLTKLLTEKGQELQQISPMIRARLLDVNGKPFEREANESGFSTREEESKRRSRNRGFNLSYRKLLSESETLIKGRPLSEKPPTDPEDPAEISIETRYAERMGFSIGDVLTFDVQGVSIKGKIVNERKVNWNSFQPNFFILFQPGILDDAPKTHVASVANLTFETKTEIQRALAKALPNISTIDVTRFVEKLIGITNQMSLALRFMALLSLVAGLVILFSIASYQTQFRKQDINMLKILGAPASQISGTLLKEFLSIATAASVFGVALSIAVSLVLSHYLFDDTWAIDLETPAITTLALLILTWIVTVLAVKKAINKKPEI
ncbi:MAG: FtsX-like permease family protein [Pseudobdellovibrionaceae bacterium]|nr:MAG: FtsX-like permease family protein [Pseudobdellovibrionaceae bacterium]